MATKKTKTATSVDAEASAAAEAPARRASRSKPRGEADEAAGTDADAPRAKAKKGRTSAKAASAGAGDGAGADATTADATVHRITDTATDVATDPATDAATPAKKPRASRKKPAAEPAPAPAPETAAPASAALLPGLTFPDTEYAVVEKLLVNFLRDEVGKVGVTRAVLGLSGGVDSAVSAAVAARALGAANVLGILMPYHSSSPESLADAHEVAAALGIETMVVDISEQVDSYFARFPDASRLRRGNKMARERMTILYDHSAARSALVIGTSNKTELLLGYGTLYGDMASALNPIGDLYKTQVWGLARHLALPASVIEKAPTADLWSGQTDENELGFSYHEVDRLLYRMIDERCSTDELVDLGFERSFVERIQRMVRSSQFKRRLPVIAKLSQRSIDTDFRYSRDWGL